MTLTIVDYPAHPSNYTAGREAVVDQIILHSIVGTILSARTVFQRAGSGRSTHYGVPWGDSAPIERYVRETNTAWGAGNWPVNCRGINIEADDNGDPWGPRPAGLYVREAQLVADICRRRKTIPLQRTTSVNVPGILDHRIATSTACPALLDTDLIIAMARGEAGVFDPRTVEADADFLKQMIRDVVISEDVAPFAVFMALGRYTGNLPPRGEKLVREARIRLVQRRGKLAAPRRKTTKKMLADARAGHGKG